MSEKFIPILYLFIYAFNYLSIMLVIDYARKQIKKKIYCSRITYHHISSGSARISARGAHFRRSASWGSGCGAPSPPDAGEFSKNFKKFLKKIANMHYLSLFFKRFNKSRVNLWRLWTKNTLLGNSEKIFKIFDKNSIGKLNF